MEKGCGKKSKDYLIFPWTPENVSCILHTMGETRIVQGREVTDEDIELIRELMRENPTWHRTRLSKELCRMWDWRTIGGRIKDMACRSMLRKLDAAGFITLPAPRQKNPTGRNWDNIQYVLHDKTPIESSLKQLRPIRIERCTSKGERDLFASYLVQYHYLSYSGPVGRNMKYLVYGRDSRVLACILFGSSAWKVADRDKYIGWDAKTRKENLHLVTNNMRYLILPWVRVKHLASHILGKVARRIRDDWQEKYGFRVQLLETFVEDQRFRGTCYRASNWVCVGKTKGRGKMDRYNECGEPVKSIWLYPLDRNFRKVLQGGKP